MELRKAVAVATVVMGSSSVACAGALVAITSYLHSLTAQVENHLHSVRAAEEIEVQLLWHARDMHLAALTGEPGRSAAAAAAKAELDDWYAAAEGYVGSPEERAVLARLGEKLAAYFREADAPAASPLDAHMRTQAPLEDAYQDAERLLAINLDQAADATARARKWDTVARAIGLSMAVLLMVLVVAVILGARRSVFRPLVELRDGIRRFGAPAYAARVPVHGVTEIRDIGRSFNEMAAALERHRQTQLAFIAAVAHDVRNPLSAIKLAATTVEHASGRAPPEQLARVIAIVSRQVDVLTHMVSDLLDAARAEAGELAIERMPCDARDLVRRCVELYEAAAAQHALVTCLPSEPVELYCDPLRIEQVVNNLISNAVKYSPSGGRVEVRLRADASHVLLEVSDEGPGIPLEEQQQIFEPFRRGSRSRGTVPGVGLGLAVARRGVEAHGGALELVSVPGRGATFTVRLARHTHAS
jgi:signal transduction histidine kinase